MIGLYDFSDVKLTKMLAFFSVGEAHDLIYSRPLGENLKKGHTCLMMGEASRETSPKTTLFKT